MKSQLLLLCLVIGLKSGFAAADPVCSYSPSDPAHWKVTKVWKCNAKTFSGNIQRCEDACLFESRNNDHEYRYFDIVTCKDSPFAASEFYWDPNVSLMQWSSQSRGGCRYRGDDCVGASSLVIQFDPNSGLLNYSSSRADSEDYRGWDGEESFTCKLIQ